MLKSSKDHCLSEAHVARSHISEHAYYTTSTMSYMSFEDLSVFGFV